MPSVRALARESGPTSSKLGWCRLTCTCWSGFIPRRESLAGQTAEGSDLSIGGPGRVRAGGSALVLGQGLQRAQRERARPGDRAAILAVSASTPSRRGDPRLGGRCGGGVRFSQRGGHGWGFAARFSLTRRVGWDLFRGAATVCRAATSVAREPSLDLSRENPRCKWSRSHCAPSLCLWIRTSSWIPRD